jgi:hypothetical protein
MKLENYKIISNKKNNQNLINTINIILNILENKKKRFLNLSIPFLNIIKLTPDNYNKYLSDSKKINKVSNLKRSFKKLIQFIKLIIFEKPKIDSKKIIKNKSEIILISHLVNKVQLFDVDQIYYSNFLSKLLIYKKITIIYINHLDDYSDQIKSHHNKYNIIVLPKRNNILKELKYIFNIFNHSLYYKKIIKNKLNQKNHILLYLSRFSNLTDSISSLRISEQIDQILKHQENIKYLISPFEGKSWERLLYFKIKKYKKINSYGYFTSPLFKNSISPFLYEYDDFLPNKILSPIRMNKILFKIRKSNLRNRIINLSTIYCNKKNDLINIDFNKISILVLPEGTIYETNILYNFIIKISKDLKDINFIFRLHPLLNKKKYLSQNNINNIKFSNRNFDEDVTSCNFVFYRGSGSIFKTIGKKIIPIYVNAYDSINIDPYYQINKFFSINSKNDFVKLIENLKKNKSTIINYLNLIQKFFELSISNDTLKKIFMNND